VRSQIGAREPEVYMVTFHCGADDGEIGRTIFEVGDLLRDGEAAQIITPKGLIRVRCDGEVVSSTFLVGNY
jgi:hypothetical protein